MTLDEITAELAQIQAAVAKDPSQAQALRPRFIELQRLRVQLERSRDSGAPASAAPSAGGT